MIPPNAGLAGRVKNRTRFDRTGRPVRSSLSVEGDRRYMARVGDFIGQYRLVRQIGEGGMDSVYEAAHTRIRSKRAAGRALIR